MTPLQLTPQWTGSILDVGGGGEGIIGRLYGHSVVDVAKAVQDAVTAAVESTTGRTVKSVNVSISGITLPRTAKK